MISNGVYNFYKVSDNDQLIYKGSLSIGDDGLKIIDDPAKALKSMFFNVKNLDQAENIMRSVNRNHYAYFIKDDSSKKEDPNEWQNSYLQHLDEDHNTKKQIHSTKQDPLEALQEQLLQLEKLTYNPKKGYILNRKLVDRGDSQPLMRNEEGPVHLVHYSPVSGLTHVRPDKYGTSGVRSEEYKRGLPEVARSYYYRKGISPESVVEQNAKSVYHATLEPHQKLYDLATDNDSLVKEALKNNHGIWNSDIILNHIKNSGYHGYYNSSSSLPGVVALFHPQAVDKEEIIRS